MMGRTHVVNGLAAAHVLLTSYTLYINRNEPTVTLDPDTGEVVGDGGLSIFGFVFGVGVPLYDYIFIVLTALLFGLLLFGIGGLGSSVGYVGGIGLMFGVMFFVAESSQTMMLTGMTFAFMIGLLLPDIDAETSTLGRYVKFISRAIPHRTITHTIWAVLLLAGATWYFESPLLLALTLGYFLHILQDTFSKQGIAWFYPIIGRYDTYASGATMKRGRKGNFAYSAGGSGELIIMVISITAHVVTVGVVVYRLVFMV